MSRLLLLIIVTLFPALLSAEKPAVLAGFAPLSEQELQSGTLRLFDGVSTYGWKNAEVKDGKLVLTGRPDSTPLRFFPHCPVDVSVPLTVENTKYRPYGTALNAAVLFDGKTLNGWKTIGDAKAVADAGTILLTGGSGALESAGKYDNFILQLEYKTDKAVNSGVFFRCIPGEKMNGYECQIYNQPPDADYDKFIGTDTGGLFRRQVGRNVGAKDGVWNYLTIAARGADIATWVNGIQVTDFKDTRKADANPRKGLRAEPGTIQFQGHDATTEIRFRNIRIAAVE
ncbi:MAG: DUF1080 domain-containing protein [Planctomycetaceae bacterium]|jgi:hypothetical protein|nr:DUF1080 domain-containing protein [Planctomycetaceae bacterium]